MKHNSIGKGILAVTDIQIPVAICLITMFCYGFEIAHVI